MNFTASLHSPELSVGRVSSLIAAIIFLLQILLPSLVPILALGLLKEDGPKIETTAANWSRISIILQASYWPTILRTESRSSKGVTKPVNVVSWLPWSIKLALAIVGVVTPLGLHQIVAPSKHTMSTEFTYAADSSSIGLGTVPRSNTGFYRECNGYPFWACPGTLPMNVSTSNYTQWLANDLRIPRTVYEIFSSGQKKFDKSVSTAFDIQWRTYTIKRDKAGRIENGTEYLVGSYRHLSLLALDKKVELVEGLIVDSVDGGIGVRNHSLPIRTEPYGYTWSEDILFLIPETQCVNTNLTMDYATKPDDELDGFDIPQLTDRGGFSAIDRDFDWSDLTDLGDDTQDTLNLRTRAYKGAWINNVLTMQYLNVTNGPLLKGSELFRFLTSSGGQRFELNASNFWTGAVGFKSSEKYGSYLSYKNAFNVSYDDFHKASDLCSGQTAGSFANISNIGVTCGLVFAPGRAPEAAVVNTTTETQLSHRIYSCASAVRAIIKTVTFKYNGTRGLLDLNVENIADKKYHDVESKPLWAVENVKRSLGDYDPFWGIADPMYSKHENISTTHKESLWLPGCTSYFDRLGRRGDSFQNVPGIRFHNLAWGTTYGVDEDGTDFDYSGKDNFQMYSRWSDLCQTEEGTARMLNLIWTDISANGVVGTRGWASEVKPVDLRQKRDAATTAKTFVPTTVYRSKVVFNYFYGIPAFVVLMASLILATGTVGTAVMRKVGTSKLSKYINHTSFGMSTASLVFTEEFCFSASEKDCSNWPQVSIRDLAIGGRRPEGIASGSAGSTDTMSEIPLMVTNDIALRNQ